MLLAQCRQVPTESTIAYRKTSNKSPRLLLEQIPQTPACIGDPAYIRDPASIKT